MRLFLLLPILLLFCGCATTAPPGVSDVEMTWRNAWVMVPEEDGPRRYRMDDPAVVAWEAGRWRLPVILYVHGCTGLGSGDEKLMRRVVEQGFVVIAPDSFARRSRPRQCEAGEKSGGNNLFVYDFRMAEVSFAVHKIQEAHWLDAPWGVLFGASEGGVTAALYRGNAFAARIITHWTCHGGALVAGIDAPPDEPVLAIVQADDPWYRHDRSPGQKGDCGAFFGDRPNSRSVVLTDGEKHNVFGNKEALAAISDFLESLGEKGATNFIDQR